MENASKALIMAGGILIALLVIGVLLLMVNQISNYQKSQNTSKKNTQIAKFNIDFERYTDDKGITGADIVSLINKINDYNTRSNDNVESGSGITNYVDYSIKMSMRVTGLENFNNLYGYQNASINDKLFTTDYYEIGADTRTTNDLRNRIKEMERFTDMEHFFGTKRVTSDQLKQLSGIYNRKLSNDQNVDNIKKTLEDWSRTDITKDDIKSNLDLIRLYRQYSEFKSSTFIVGEQPVYADNGQIQRLVFVFDR